MYKYLFSPIRINNLEIKNRIAYPALGLIYSYDRKLNERYNRFYAERSKGGAGLLTIGPVGVDFIGSGFLTLGIDNDDAIPDFKKLTDIIKAGGARPWIQLFHAGAYAHPVAIDGKTPIGPSPVYSKYSKCTPREMTIEDIENVKEAFADAAGRAVESGFAGIEIIASAGYLLTQFLSPVKNLRTDQYGGNFEKRVRFPREIIECVRKRIGTGIPLTIRMAGNDFIPGSNTDTEAAEIAKVYEASGIDAINVTGGWHETRVPQLPMNLPRSAFAFLSLNIKNAVSLPVMASNRISDPDTAENIIKTGYADMVNLGRVLIADPEWPKKAFEGRKNEIRPCTACSQGCTDMVFQGKPVFCTGNPRAGYETERNVVQTTIPKNVMVVGAGVAGLEAAVTAAEIGHRVELYEKDRDIGGQVWIAGAPPHKQELWEFVRYYRAMIQRYEIPVHLNTTVDATLIEARKPDHVIVAEGAEALIPPIPGVDGPGVLTAWEVLRENSPLGKKIAVIGGGAVGLETALFVAAKGTLTPEVLHFLFSYEALPIERLRELLFRGSSHVTVFEMLPKVGKDVGRSTKWVLFDSLKQHGVEIREGTKVLAIEDKTIRYESENAIQAMPFDNIIIASGSKASQQLTKEIEKLRVAFTLVGDCIRPGRINDAIHGGFMAALNLD